MALMVCVWLPNWAVQRLRHERPELRSRPVVLFTSDGNRGPRVAAWARSEAHRDNGEGIKIGMPLAEAEAVLAGHVDSTAHIEAHDPAADLAGLRELARTCNDFSPLLAHTTQPVVYTQLDPSCGPKASQAVAKSVILRRPIQRGWGPGGVSVARLL